MTKAFFLKIPVDEAWWEDSKKHCPKYASDILEIPVLIRNNPNKSQQFEESGDDTRSRHV